MEVGALPKAAEGFDNQQAEATSGVTMLYFKTIRQVFLPFF